MTTSKLSFAVFSAMALFAITLPTVALGQSFPPAPAPAPTSDGASVDQGIAYMLMLLALVLTYVIHSPHLDAHVLS